MLKTELIDYVSQEQYSILNAFHLLGYGFLKNAGANINHSSDDHFSKIEKLGKAVMHLNGLRLKAKERGISTQFSFVNSNNPKESWTESEKLGWSIMLPGRSTIEMNDSADLSLIEKASMSSKELEIISKVGFILKESQMIESLLAAKPVNSVSLATQPKKPEEGKQLAASTPQEAKKYWTSADQELAEGKEKLSKKVRSWEIKSTPDPKKRSWE